MVGQREGVDDLVLILHSLVEPGIVSAAADDEDVGLVGLSDVCRGGLKVVRVDAVAFDDGLNLDVDICLRSVDDGFCYVGPDGGGGDNLDGVGVAGALGVGARACSEDEAARAQGGN